MRGKTSGGGRNGLLPNSIRIISSCLKTVSSNAESVASSVRSVGASVAQSIAAPVEDVKDQVLWAGFDRLELSSSSFKHVLLLGYSNGFQVLDVENATDVHELVSKRGGPVTFLAMQPIPAKTESPDSPEGFRLFHPLLAVVGDESSGSGTVQGSRLSAMVKDGCIEYQEGTSIPNPRVVRFFSLKSNNIVHVLRFRSAVYIVRCSLRIVAVSLAVQIYCFDADTLENKFNVLTYPVQAAVGVNVGYGPMSLGSRWLAYASDNPLLPNTGRVSPQNLLRSPGISPSTSPSSSSLVARYAVESSKQLAVGIICLGDMGYKTLSKYYQELLPDGPNSPMSSSSGSKIGCSPLSSSSGRKTGSHTSSAKNSEADNAGMVVVKDIVSKDVISQFKAHSSPISALCFDPTGTLLVTASICGNNMNVFRILPKPISNDSNSACYDWTSAHVHLYKLYRGLTKAVIQDISFSRYSQWISIVSSKGTCHLYVLSPFGGETGFQTQYLHNGGSALVPNVSLPWWSNSSCINSRQVISPPPVVTLSVVSRIKNGSSGWSSTVNAIAASAAGKLHIPSGAVTAVFHNSASSNSQRVDSKEYPLEYLLVHSPSGHVIQHELYAFSPDESCNISSKTCSGSQLQVQDEELGIQNEPVQWWDVCRRSSWPERDECISNVAHDVHQTAKAILEASHCGENDTKQSALSTNSISEKSKTHERPSWYLSNAEVRGCCGMMPIWQESEITFYTINPSPENWRSMDDNSGGEIEIEKIHVCEVQITQKDPLPIFQHFHGVQSDLHERSLSDGSYLAGASAGSNQNSIKLAEDRVVQLPLASKNKPELLKFIGSISELENTSYYGSPQSADLLAHCFAESVNGSRGTSFGSISGIKPDAVIMPGSSVQDIVAFQSENAHDSNSIMDICLVGNFSFGSEFSSDDRHTKHSDNGNGSDISILSDGNAHSLQSIESPDYIQEGYCKLSELDNCHGSNEAVSDADSNISHCDREKHEESDDNDEMFGGVFAFAEEGELISIASNSGVRLSFIS